MTAKRKRTRKIIAASQQTCWGQFESFPTSVPLCTTPRAICMPCTDVKSRVGKNSAERWGQTNKCCEACRGTGGNAEWGGENNLYVCLFKFDFKFKTHYKDHLHPMSDPPKPRAENSFAVHIEAAHFAAPPENSALPQHWVISNIEKRRRKKKNLRSLTRFHLDVPQPRLSCLHVGLCTSLCHRHQTLQKGYCLAAARQRLGRGNQPENHATIYFRVPLSNFLIFGGKSLFHDERKQVWVLCFTWWQF